MQKISGLGFALASIIWAGSTLTVSAQQLPGGSGAPPEFWSARYQRFYETQHEPMIVSSDIDRPTGNLMAPPDVIVDDAPGGGIAESKEIATGKAGQAHDTTTGVAPRH